MAISLGSLGSIFISLGLRSTLDEDVDKAEGKLAKAGTNLKSIGTSLMKTVSLPIIAVGTDILHTSVQFETAMNKVMALTEAPAGEFDKLRQSAIKLGADTVFSAGQAADAMGILAQAGLGTSDILKAARPIMDLAAAGEVEMAQAADFATSAMYGFGKGSDDLTHIVDVMTKGAAASNASVTSLAEALNYAAPIAKLAGVSMEETVAAIGTLSNAGVQGMKAGTGLRAVFAALLDPSKQATKVLEHFGVSVAALQSGVLKPLDALKKLSAAGVQTSDLFKIFGREAAGVAGILGANSDATDKLAKSFVNADGTASKMADTMQSGVVGAVNQIKGSWETLQLAIADSGLKKVFEEVLLGATDFFNMLAKTNPETLKLATILAVVAAAAGPVIVALGAITAAVAAIGVPTAAAIAAITLLVTGFLAFKDEIVSGSTSIGQQWGALWDRLKSDAAPVLAELQTTAIAAFAGIKDALGPIWTDIVTIVTDSAKILLAVLEMPSVRLMFVETWDVIKTIVSSSWTVISGVVGGGVKVISGIIQVALGALTLNWSTFSKGVVTIVQGLWQGIVAVFQGGLQLIKGLTVDLYNDVTATFKKLGDTLVGHSIVPDEIVDPVIDEFGRMADFSMVHVDRLSTGITSTMGRVGMATQSFLGTVLKKIQPSIRGWLGMAVGIERTNTAAAATNRQLKTTNGELTGTSTTLEDVGSSIGDTTTALGGLNNGLAGLGTSTSIISMKNGVVDLSKTFGNLVGDIINAFASGGSVTNVLKEFGLEILELAGEKIMGKLIGQVASLIDKIPGIGTIADLIFGTATKTATGAAAGAAGSVGTAAAGAASSAAGAAGSAASAGSSGAGAAASSTLGSVASITGIVTGIISAGTGIFSAAVQNNMKDTLNAMHNDTSYLAWNFDQGGLHDALLGLGNNFKAFADGFGGWFHDYLVDQGGREDAMVSSLASIDASMMAGGGGVYIDNIIIQGNVAGAADIAKIADAVGEEVFRRIREGRAT
jgi:TP901 family phage tail tape measure protein